MAERRGMGQALALSPEKMAFIQGGKATPTSDAPVALLPSEAPAAAPSKGTESTSTPNDVTAVASPPSRSRRSRPSAQPRRPEIPSEPINTNFNGQLLVPITTRLRPTTANALRRACLEMKLRGEQPNCQQDIAETAIAVWLSENGFL